MTIFLILSFIRWESINGAIYHIIVGSGCTLFFSIHVFIHRKWIKATTKSCLSGKLSKTLRGKYAIDILMLMVWGIAIITGFIALAPFFGVVDGGLIWGRVHGIAARIGLVLVIIHVIQHIPQIMSYFGVKKRLKTAS